jgi:fibronectin type 3 domain-containing protein
MNSLVGGSITAFVLMALCFIRTDGGTRVFAKIRESSSASSSAESKAPLPAHVVKLSWNASVPASKSPRDAIVGYIVYRSTNAHDPNAVAITSSKIPSTTYSDSTVESGKTYYYVTRAVTAGGTLSGPSNEFRVVGPH